MSDEVKMIPIDQIHILNPRQRDKKRFEVIVESIRNVGLKKPVQISRRSEDEAVKPKYDLICGQGRIEAFKALGHTEIPAVIVEISKEERLVRSLVENIARRYPAPMDLIREIERLKSLGYNFHQISKKLNVSDEMVKGLMTLKKAGEERLLEAAVTGKIPLWVAIDIAKTDTIEMQRELLKAYENKQLNYLSIRTVKRLIEQRRLIGKQRGGRIRGQKAKTSAESLVSAYRRESQRQKLMVKKAQICDARLVFIVTAFGKLMADENFVTLLRAESLATMPKSLWTKITPQQREAA
ncbi:MAG: ParB N-terminal domain-containing protein [Verrucomicrobiota bacterium]|nr:ParB N-terminal domain-containing protein [Verrucomicrobiota bacterium]